MKTCAICGYRDATGKVELDGRMFPSCRVCYRGEGPDEDDADEEPIRLAMSDLTMRVRDAMRGNGGMRVSDLCELLGVEVASSRTVRGTGSRRRYEAVVACLRRLIRYGYVTREGVKCAGCLYSYVSAARERELDEERHRWRVEHSKKMHEVLRARRAA